MLLPMVSRPFAFLERRGQRAQLEIARAFQSAPGSSEISTCTLMRSASPWRVCEQHAARRSRYGVAKDHALADFRRRLKVLDAICADGGQVGTPNCRAALSAVSMPGALLLPLADK